MTRIEIPNSSRGRGAPRRGMRIFTLILVLILAGGGLWTWLTLAWAYSDGERAGVLQKFSRRGWICKTQEGEIAQYLVAGISPQMWQFSVRDKTVAAQLDKAVGHRVQLHYTEHPGVPTDCFADTRYFVDRVIVTDDPWATAPGATQPAGSAAPTGAAPGVPAATVAPGAAPVKP